MSLNKYQIINISFSVNSFEQLGIVQCVSSRWSKTNLISVQKSSLSVEFMVMLFHMNYESTVLICAIKTLKGGEGTDTETSEAWKQ